MIPRYLVDDEGPIWRALFHCEFPQCLHHGQAMSLRLLTKNDHGPLVLFILKNVAVYHKLSTSKYTYFCTMN